MSRTLKGHDLQLLTTLATGEKRHSELAPIFKDNDKGFSENLLKTLCQMKQAGFVTSVQRGDRIAWRLTSYGKDML